MIAIKRLWLNPLEKETCGLTSTWRRRSDGGSAKIATSRDQSSRSKLTINDHAIKSHDREIMAHNREIMAHNREIVAHDRDITEMRGLFDLYRAAPLIRNCGLHPGPRSLWIRFIGRCGLHRGTDGPHCAQNFFYKNCCIPLFSWTFDRFVKWIKQILRKISSSSWSPRV